MRPINFLPPSLRAHFHPLPRLSLPVRLLRTRAQLTRRPLQPSIRAAYKEEIESIEAKKAEALPPRGLTKYAYRWETTEPTGEMLRGADDFFLRYPPSFLWSAEKFKTIEFGDVPEKSSMLNALLNNKNLAFTSSKPGRTRLMNAFGINQKKLIILDMPGYGHGSREEWGTQIMKYLRSRKQFRRAFVLIDAKHGVKPADMMLLEHLGTEGISYQIVLSKVDRLNPHDGSLRKVFEDIKYLMETGLAGVSGLGEILATAADPSKKGAVKIGISELRWAVMVAGGLGVM
ncbi:hypothetical protein RUND412_007329 [Rhizina undulata]